MEEDDTSPDEAARGTLIAAENGDVIRYEPTGLSLRLSDRVIADIAARLDLPTHAPQTKAELSKDYVPLPPELDVWDIRPDGAWLRFLGNLPGQQGPRGFVRAAQGGAVLADTPGALLGLLAIGGPRSALATQRTSHYPYHITAPADDIGAVGHAGVSRADPLNTLEGLREMSHEALVAEVLLDSARLNRTALPLFVVRAETDSSAQATDLANGLALTNLAQAAANLHAAAQEMGKRAEVLSVGLDFSLEDVGGDAGAYRDGMLALMENVTEAFGKIGFPAPCFTAFFECGTQDLVSDAILDGQWELAWNTAGHDIVIVGPSYMLALDDTARLTDDARDLRAMMTAEAIMAQATDATWQCPTLHLAEADGDVIRVTTQCQGKLVLDKTDPFEAGEQFGFSLEGVTRGIKITSVDIDAKDNKALLIRCNKPVAGTAPILHYASGAAPRDHAYPANAGALRDDFEPVLSYDAARDTTRLRRWALPARLPIH